MKKQRSLPFGYTLRGGLIETVKSEARLVRRIYQMCEDGGSLDSITKALTKQGVPYSDINPEWNKHKVKRILENAKYMGVDGFPAILEREVFERVRALYEQKTQPWHEPVENPQKHVWKRLVCAECGGRLKRVGGRCKDTTLLECDRCGLRIQLRTDALLETLSEQVKTAMAPETEPVTYQPTLELMRLESEINRGIEKHNDGKAIRRLIQQAAAKRYALCPRPAQEEPDTLTADAIWRLFKISVDAALITSTGEIQIRLKQERM